MKLRASWEHLITERCERGACVCSIAIMTDAVHELSDALNYAIAIYATVLTGRQSTSQYTFGYHRAETIGALINVVSICVLSLTLVMQAIERLVEPEDIDGRCGCYCYFWLYAFRFQLLFRSFFSAFVVCPSTPPRPASKYATGLYSVRSEYFVHVTLVCGHGLLEPACGVRHMHQCMCAETLCVSTIHERQCMRRMCGCRMMFIFAAAGLGINVFLLLTMGHDHDHDHSLSLIHI